MLRSTKSLLGFKLSATDKEIGSVQDFYFEDDTFIIRYLVADTGNWLTGRKVLLPPNSIGQPDIENEVFPVELSSEQIEKAPGIDADKPVSRQWETQYFTYFGWAPYWTTGTMQPMITPIPRVRREPRSKSDIENNDPHLRSAQKVTGYHIAAIDGEIGHVEDFILEDTQWIIRYLVIDTRNWLPGRKVLVSPLWLQDIVWEEKKVYVDLHRNVIENSPEYQPGQLIHREYEVRLYDHYDEPKYWE
jgi:hypothetical protein